MTSSNINTIDIPQCEQGDISEQAAEWCVYLYSGQATDPGRDKFSQWLKTSDEHSRTYAAIEQTWRDMEFIACDQPAPPASQLQTGMDTDRQVIEIASGKPAFGKRIAIAAFATAATILVAVGLWNTVLHTPDAATQYASGTAETKTIELADGSQLTLGGASVVEALFSQDHREVRLVRGRAYFDVTHNPDHPFIVRAAATSIEVVGTEFDVAFNDSDISVSVAQGTVDISKAPTEDTADTSPDVVRLNRGQQITASFEGALSTIHTFDMKQLQAWRSGRLEYVDTRLADVLAEVNRYRKQKILLADKTLGDMRITLAMPANETDRLLSSLERMAPLKVVRTPLGVTIRSTLDTDQPER